MNVHEHRRPTMLVTSRGAGISVEAVCRNITLEALVFEDSAGDLLGLSLHFYEVLGFDDRVAITGMESLIAGRSFMAMPHPLF